MFARVARFEGEPGEVETLIARVRERVGGELPPALRDAKLLLLVDPETGASMNVTLYESAEARRAGDEALGSFSRDGGARTAVEFYEVPVSRL